MKTKGTENGIRIFKITLAVLLFLLLFFSISNVTKSSGSSGRERLETAVRKGALNCYAMEGVYPENIEYLEEHYGLQVDRERYVVHYTVFAENLMPDITVTEK